MNGTKKCRLRASRVFLAMGIIVGTLFGADGLRRSFESQQPSNITVDGDFRDPAEQTEPSAGSSLSYEAADQLTTSFEGVKYLGYSEYEISKDDISKGLLPIYTDEAPADKFDRVNLVKLNDVKNEFYYLAGERIYLNASAADALNRMMEDYANETGLADFIVYGTTETYTGEGSYCPKAFSESSAGYCVDLALNANGTVLTYDGYDAQGWIVQNCWKYGYIVRYPENKSDKTGHEYCPWHLRYVGEIHAAILTNKGLSLEEYVDLLRQYSFEEPYTFTFNDERYQIYSVSGSEDTLGTRVPISGKYEISGDNRESFIITSQKN